MSNVRPHVAEKSASYEVLKKLERSSPWPRVPLTEAIDLNPKPDRSSLADDLEVSFVPMAAVEAGTGAIDTSTVRRYGEVKKGYTYFRDGDVLFAKITPCMENGKMAVARQLRNGIGFGSTEFHVLRPRDGVDAHYVYYFVSSARFRAEAAHQMTGAVGQKRVATAFLEESEIPLPPIDEQQRIVAELEKQFSRLEKTIANLRRVKANLKRYKAAVLKASVEGCLVPTEAELAQREGQRYETGAQLLQRILEARRSRSIGKTTYKEPATADRTDLPQLPDGWVWTAAEQISEFITKGTTPSAAKLSDGIGEIQFLKVYNLTFDGVLNQSHKPAFVSRATHERELARSMVRAGDVLINIVGPPLGQVSVVPMGVREANINQAIARFRPISPMTPKYLAIMLMTDKIMRWAIRRAKTTAGQANLTLQHCRQLPIPLPPLVEQARIVAEVERCFSVGDRLERQVLADLARAENIRRAVLRRAFSE